MDGNRHRVAGLQARATSGAAARAGTLEMMTLNRAQLASGGLEALQHQRGHEQGAELEDRLPRHALELLLARRVEAMMERTRSAGSARCVARDARMAPTALPPPPGSSLGRMFTGSMATSGSSGSAPSSSRLGGAVAESEDHVVERAAPPGGRRCRCARAPAAGWRRRVAADLAVQDARRLQGAMSSSSPCRRAERATSRSAADLPRRAQLLAHAVQERAECRSWLLVAAAGAVARRPARQEERRVTVAGIRRQAAREQAHRGEAVDQRVVHLHVEREAPALEALDDVQLQGGRGNRAGGCAGARPAPARARRPGWAAPSGARGSRCRRRRPRPTTAAGA